MRTRFESEHCIAALGIGGWVGGWGDGGRKRKESELVVFCGRKGRNECTRPPNVGRGGAKQVDSEKEEIKSGV